MCSDICMFFEYLLVDRLHYISLVVEYSSPTSRTLAPEILEGDSNPTYCNDHKKGGMENIVSLRCCEQGCSKHPSFGLEGDPTPTHYGDHTKECMQDIVGRRCWAEQECTKRPSFGLGGGELLC